MASPGSGLRRRPITGEAASPRVVPVPPAPTQPRSGLATSMGGFFAGGASYTPQSHIGSRLTPLTRVVTGPRAIPSDSDRATPASAQPPRRQRSHAAVPLNVYAPGSVPRRARTGDSLQLDDEDAASLGTTAASMTTDTHTGGARGDSDSDVDTLQGEGDGPEHADFDDGLESPLFGASSSTPTAAVLAAEFGDETEGDDLGASDGYTGRGGSRGGDESTAPLLGPDAAARGPAPTVLRVRSSLTTALLYGAVQATILVPVLVSFAGIIFRHAYFSEAMPYLIKLVIFSSIVHQSVFCLFSTLTFAIGQVQDAGLIFLAKLSSDIVNDGLHKGHSHDVIFATVLCSLALATATLGLALLLTGKLKLASLVQYMPMPVVGGYLAFIGFYCMEAGLSLMSGEEVSGVQDWHRLFHRDAMILVVPGVLLGIALVLITTRFRHFAVLPLCLLAIPVGFHLVLLAADVSLAEARVSLDKGWLAPATNATDFWLVWDHFEVKKVDWGVLPSLIPTWLAMFFVVAFSSSLDVAAIQMELGGRVLDFNHELMTVGLSNLISGCTGGFTGSYIFSQTLLSMRAGIRSRVVGVIVIILELAVFMLPFSILAYIPKFFFGAVLTFIAIDLVYGWLFLSYKLVSLPEFFIIWITTIIIAATNLEIGIASGLGISVLAFVLQYSRVRNTRRIIKRSNIVRGFPQRTVLGQHRQRIVALQLSGYIFFGSALGIVKEVKAALGMSVPLPSSRKPAKRREYEEQVERLQLRGRMYLALDLTHVAGVDATAVRTCFVALAQLMTQHGYTMVLSGISDDARRLFEAHGVLVPGQAAETHEKEPTPVEDESDAPVTVRIADTMDSALEWCEDDILRREASEHHRRVSLTYPGIEGILATYVADDGPFETSSSELLSEVRAYFEELRVSEGEMLFHADGAPDAIYFVLSGEVTLNREVDGPRARSSSRLPSIRELVAWSKRRSGRPATSTIATRPPRQLRFTEGACFGDVDFSLRQPRSYQAECTHDGVVYRLSRARLEGMQEACPRGALFVHHILLKSLSQTVSNNLDSFLS